MGLDITEEALRTLVDAAGDGPVTLVNLVRLRAGGEQAYRDYLEAIGPCFADAGAEAVWLGEALPAGDLIDDAGQRYDRAAVVRYPSAAALEQLLCDERFLAAAPLRHAALEAGILHAFHG